MTPNGDLGPGVVLRPSIGLRLSGEAATARLGALLAEFLRPGDLVLLEGDLGAGKTTLARHVIHALGVPESEPVTSPTFALIHEFTGRVPVLHADLYRLPPDADLLELGLGEALERAVALVEWGAGRGGVLSRPAMTVELRLGDRADERNVLLTLDEAFAARDGFEPRILALAASTTLG